MKQVLKILLPLFALFIVATAISGIPTLASDPVPSLTPQSYLPLALKEYAGTPVVPLGLIVNQQHVDLFSTIPDNAIANAAALRMMLRRASVGGNISGGLDALYTQNHKYNRSNWDFQDRGNPGWQAKIQDFMDQTAAQASTKDVLGMKFCYIDPDASWTYYRDHMEQLMAAYPTKKFVWWTMPIMTTGDASRDAFNNNVRAYAQTHNIILYDIAAIESHDLSGNPVTNNGHEAMYSPYSSDGGHLNTAGAQRAAQAFWYLMARIAGWS